MKRVALALAFHYACFATMLWLTLLAEARPAPSLPDLLLPHVPYVAWVDRYNYALWVVAHIPFALYLVWRDRERFVRYSVTAGLLALVRGLSILATGLGPVRGADINAGLDAEARWRAFWEIVFLRGVFTDNTPSLYLTKDLFFSGHAATTLLLVLYVWPRRELRWAALVGHVLVVLSVFLAHLHYTIDVIGAYAVTFSLFVLREGWSTHRNAIEAR
jgi:hypothetical protein